jgi:nucleotide-binding universal stress UspA family protein
MPERPILIAYDGSEDAKSAITSAGELLTPAPALVVTAWPAAERSVGTSGGVIATYSPIFGEIDELERTNARTTAEEGAALARQAGFDANPLIVRSSDRNVWHAILDLGAEHDARAIVLGSRGQGGLTDVLLGSVPGRVVHHADRPVLVVRAKRSS